MPLVEAALLEILACPACHAPLREEAEEGTGDAESGELVCTSDTCGLAYPVQDGIPVLLEDEARRTG
ncbi:Trm112 family protein [Streptomyces sp. NPDC049879]|uniref:Trm112 family protein n=1 Tax=Streptomyces sp. NPDC049879 TaxID=3365598 RepID=UPI0037A2014F